MKIWIILYVIEPQQLSKLRQFKPSQVCLGAMYHKLLCSKNLNKAAKSFVIYDETKICTEY